MKKRKNKNHLMCKRKIMIKIFQKLSPPKVNSVFDSEVEVCEYYRRYGQQNGFGITIRNTRKIDGVSTYLTVACHRYGDSHRKVVGSLKG